MAEPGRAGATAPIKDPKAVKTTVGPTFEQLTPGLTALLGATPATKTPTPATTKPNAGEALSGLLNAQLKPEAGTIDGKPFYLAKPTDTPVTPADSFNRIAPSGTPYYLSAEKPAGVSRAVTVNRPTMPDGVVPEKPVTDGIKGPYSETKSAEPKAGPDWGKMLGSIGGGLAGIIQAASAARAKSLAGQDFDFSKDTYIGQEAKRQEAEKALAAEKESQDKALAHDQAMLELKAKYDEADRNARSDFERQMAKENYAREVALLEKRAALEKGLAGGGGSGGDSLGIRGLAPTAAAPAAVSKAGGEPPVTVGKVAPGSFESEYNKYLKANGLAGTGEDLRNFKQIYSLVDTARNIGQGGK